MHSMWVGMLIPMKGRSAETIFRMGLGLTHTIRLQYFIHNIVYLHTPYLGGDAQYHEGEISRNNVQNGIRATINLFKLGIKL